MISRSTLAALLALPLAAVLLTGCPDNGSKPGSAPSSGSAAPAAASGAPAAATGSAKTGSSGSGW